MAVQPIPLIYSDKHRQHEPQFDFIYGAVLAYAESPLRVERIRQQLEASGLVTLVEPNVPLSKDEIAQTHDRGMIDYLERMSQEVDQHLLTPDMAPSIRRVVQGADYLYPYVFPPRRAKNHVGVRRQFYSFDIGSPIGRHTWTAALWSATVAATGASLLLEGRRRFAYALCRPPGHHAGPDFFGGYCYLNNAAIAARRLLELGKVAIVDIDFHHGNGTQAIFWKEQRVFCGSLHADPSVGYPFYSGYGDETGSRKARGTKLNIPLPVGTDGDTYLRALGRVLDAVSAFKPRALLVSLGFDAFAQDPYGLFKLTGEDYRHIGTAVAGLGLPTLLVQEGGYDVDALGLLAQQFVEGLLGISATVPRAQSARPQRHFRSRRISRPSRAASGRSAPQSRIVARRLPARLGSRPYLTKRAKSDRICAVSD